MAALACQFHTRWCDSIESAIDPSPQFFARISCLNSGTAAKGRRRSKSAVGRTRHSRVELGSRPRRGARGNDPFRRSFDDRATSTWDLHPIDSTGFAALATTRMTIVAARVQPSARLIRADICCRDAAGTRHMTPPFQHKAAFARRQARGRQETGTHPAPAGGNLARRRPPHAQRTIGR